MGRFQEPRWLRATDADRRRRLMLQGCPLFGALLILAFMLVPIAGPPGQADTLRLAVPPPCDGRQRPESCIQPRPPIPPRPPAQGSVRVSRVTVDATADNGLAT